MTSTSHPASQGASPGPVVVLSALEVLEVPVDAVVSLDCPVSRDELDPAVGSAAEVDEGSGPDPVEPVLVPDPSTAVDAPLAVDPWPGPVHASRASPAPSHRRHEDSRAISPTIPSRTRGARPGPRLRPPGGLGYARRMGSGSREALRPLLWVFLAGGVGATLRVVLAGLIDARWSDRLPYVGTLVVNMAGCLAIGVAAAAIPPGTARTAVVGGLLGGFTTYSAFALFSVELFHDERLGTLVTQIGLHLVLGMVCAAAGLALGRAVFGPAGP